MTRSQEEQLGGSGKLDQYIYLNDPYYRSAEYAAIVERQRRDMADIRAGKLDDDEAGCPSCGSHELFDISGDYPTGVVGPDGGQEVRHEQGYGCGQCGAVTNDEELNRTGEGR